MKKKLLLIGILLLTVGLVWNFSNQDTQELREFKAEKLKIKKGKKSPEERALYAKERELHELKFQINPNTGEIPLDEKQRELNSSKQLLELQKRTTSSTYISRGPSNLGGRTRALAIDVSDESSNTIIAGGISGGVFRSTDGGASWVKVSANNEIHNVSAIAQDTRAGFQNIWYYGTGEWSGNSASLGSPYRGNGVWKSTDSGLTWSKISSTDSSFTSFDSFFDYVTSMQVNPVSGELLIGTGGKVYSYDGTNMSVALEIPSNNTGWTDVKITNNGRAYAAIQGTSSVGGVWTSPPSKSTWTKIAENGTPSGWSAQGRIVLGAAPSNDDVIYALYVNGAGEGSIQADLWKYNFGSNTWTDYSSKLPDEPGGNSGGNDPFHVQGGYDLVVSVKPNDENFLVIGGTNTYKIEDVTTDVMFTRIGGYRNNSGYALYDIGGTTHHPDIHALVFDPKNSDILLSGTDGGVHKTDVTQSTVVWSNLNNNYLTYQYYHVAMDMESGSDIVVGGAQDNGTTMGGTDAGLSDKTSMTSIAGGDGVAVGLGRNNGDLRTYLGFQNGTIFQRKSGFTEITPSGSSSQFVTYFYLDPDNNNALYYAGLSKLYKTSNVENITSSTWSDIGTLSTNENLRTFATTRGAYNASSSYLLIGGNSGGVFRLDDPQNATNLSSAVNITPTDASKASNTIVSDIAIHPTNPDIVMAVYSNYGIKNIFITENATSATPTWTEVERNLNNHSVRSATIAQVGSEIIYFVGTARGLYSSSDPKTNDWDIEGADKIGLAVVSSLVYRPSDKKLLIGTHGNGMYETTVEGTLSTNSYTKNSLGLTLYPNPVVDMIKFNSDLIKANESINYEIYNISGKIVKKGSTLEKQIRVDELNSGIYIVNVTYQNKKQALKIVKK